MTVTSRQVLVALQPDQKLPLAMERSRERGEERRRGGQYRSVICQFVQHSDRSPICLRAVQRYQVPALSRHLVSHLPPCRTRMPWPSWIRVQQGGRRLKQLAEKMAADMFAKVMENQLLQTAKLMEEEQLDAELDKLDQMDEDEMERLKEKRLEALKKAQQQKQEWISKGHGEYREIPSEREFFTEVKESKNVICHFYKDSTFRCKILDKHLAVLAKKHFETKFLKLNVEKAPFLCERLRIKVIPTLALVKDGKTRDYIVGFTDLGNTDEFTTETLEWRLGCADIITYSGNLMEPPFQSQKKYGSNFTKLEKKSIRGKKYDSDSDDDD
ncbi:unnamed protein product [Ranitomeya imitator]|uniref:Thioredoxin domain-containing protein 9 n=1 Tax=Ranitomeya imitator TaxID=111125 RepID=A0ABN9M621_9NEOB|nr:unnamed protein product [Ranitomeya imitator]